MQVLFIDLCVIAALYYNDLYDFRAVRSFGEFATQLFKALGSAGILLYIFFRFFPYMAHAGSPLFSSLLVVLLATGLLLPLRGIFYALLKTDKFAERVLILGTGPLARKIAEEVGTASHLGYRIIGFVDDRWPAAAGNPSLSSYSVYGSLERFDEIVNTLNPDRIFVALTERRGRLPVRDLLNARMAGIVVEDGIEVLERFTEKLAIESLTPSFLIFSQDFKKAKFQLTLQRAVSLILTTVGLVVSAPLLAIIAVAIKLDSRGPVFFIQKRAGIRGQPFHLVKFRTMHPSTEEEQDSVWDRDTDSRVTRVGRWLRKLRLDELPQFVNILRGDMDLVGPRPEMVENVRTMTEQIPYYTLRTMVRPGITGWAQVKHGYSVSQEDVTEKMRYDLYYVKHMSPWFDLKILVDTVKIVLLGQESKAASQLTKGDLIMSPSEAIPSSFLPDKGPQEKRSARS
jgi:sugar transferase (PEP-CTERM system associated)